MRRVCHVCHKARARDGNGLFKNSPAFAYLSKLILGWLITNEDQREQCLLFSFLLSPSFIVLSDYMRRRLSDFVTPDPDRTSPFQIPTSVSRTHAQVSDPSLPFATRGLAPSQSETLPSACLSQNGALNDEGHALGDPRPSFSRPAISPITPAYVQRTSIQNESPLHRAG